MSGYIVTNNGDRDTGPINGTGPVSVREACLISSLIIARIQTTELHNRSDLDNKIGLSGDNGKLLKAEADA